MSRIVACLSALALGACASTGAPRADAPTERCDMTVAFGSYGSGIDRVLHEQIVRFLAHDNRVGGVIERGWGREGETTLCVRTRNSGDMERLIAELRAMAASAGGIRAPTTVAYGATNFPRAS